MDEDTTPSEHDEQVGNRQVPDLMEHAWQTATADTDPLVALGATRALKAHLSTWETQLVREAMADGATWESIGDSVGVSRQAAWDRFHHEVHELRRQRRQDMDELRRKFRDEARQLHHRYRDAMGGAPRGRGRGRSRGPGPAAAE